MPQLPRLPRQQDHPEALTELGIQAFEEFGVKADDYISMDLTRYREGVLFELKNGPCISWEYRGRLYFGSIRHKKNS